MAIPIVRLDQTPKTHISKEARSILFELGAKCQLQVVLCLANDEIFPCPGELIALGVCCSFRKAFGV